MSDTELSSDRAALSEFVASISEAPAGEQEKLSRAARWAEKLLSQDLVQLALSSQPQKTQWTLTVRPKRSSGALAVVFNDGPASVGLWRTVFERLAPNAIAGVEEVAAIKIGQGNAVRSLTEEFFDALTVAYREAANISDPLTPGLAAVTSGVRIDARAFLSPATCRRTHCHDAPLR